jgi:large subunit ribosomal protein L19e
MNLKNKKLLASKVLRVGKKRIWFDSSRLSEIQEAITKQDIRDLFTAKAILIKPIKGRKTVVKRKTRRGPGKIKRTIKNRKQTYVKITRKLRNYIKELKKQGKINDEEYKEIRKKIKMRTFRSKAHLKENIENKFKVIKTKSNKKIK